MSDKTFQADFSSEEGHMTCKLSGRLDTVTAPGFLDDFKAQAPEDLKEITLDIAGLQYVSSAGLRVFLILYKMVPDSEGFHIVNVPENVMEVLELTGFAQIFGL